MENKSPCHVLLSHTARLGHLTFLFIMSPIYSRLMLHIMQWQMRLCVSLWYLISTHAKIQDQMAECQSFFLGISHFLVCNVITCGCCIWDLQCLRKGLDHVTEPLQLDKNCENRMREEENMIFLAI